MLFFNQVAQSAEFGESLHQVQKIVKRNQVHFNFRNYEILALVFQNLLLEIDSHDGRVKSLLEEASKLSEKAETTEEQKEKGLIFLLFLKKCEDVNLSFRKISRRFKTTQESIISCFLSKKLYTPRINSESNSKPENLNFREKNFVKLDLKLARNNYEINLKKRIFSLICQKSWKKSGMRCEEPRTSVQRSSITIWPCNGKTYSSFNAITGLNATNHILGCCLTSKMQSSGSLSAN